MVAGNSKGILSLFDLSRPDYDAAFPYKKVHDLQIQKIRVLQKSCVIFTADRSGSVKLTSLTFHGEMKDSGSWISPTKDLIKDLSFGPQELKMATAHEEKSIKIWDVATVKPERKLEGHGSDVQTVDWHPSKALLASGSKDRLLKFWDPVSGRNVCTLFNNTNTIHRVRFSRNENFLAAVGKDQLVRLYDLRMMKEFLSLQGHNCEVTDFEWSPRHENQFVSADVEGKVFLWVYPHEIPSHIQLHEKGVQVSRATFNSLGNAVATLGADKRIRIWKVTDRASGPQ